MTVFFEDPQLLEGGVDGVGEARRPLFIDLRRSVQNNKEGEQQGHKVGVGDQPAFVIDLGLGSATTVSHGRWTPAAVMALGDSGKKPISLLSSMRGFIPSRMETAPSTVISRI